jgi:hypothetical protein
MQIQTVAGKDPLHRTKESRKHIETRLCYRIPGTNLGGVCRRHSWRGRIENERGTGQNNGWFHPPSVHGHHAGRRNRGGVGPQLSFPGVHAQIWYRPGSGGGAGFHAPDIYSFGGACEEAGHPQLTSQKLTASDLTVLRTCLPNLCSMSDVFLSSTDVRTLVELNRGMSSTGQMDFQLMASQAAAAAAAHLPANSQKESDPGVKMAKALEAIRPIQPRYQLVQTTGYRTYTQPVFLAGLLALQKSCG